MAGPLTFFQTTSEEFEERGVHLQDRNCSGFHITRFKYRKQDFAHRTRQRYLNMDIDIGIGNLNFQIIVSRK